MKRAATVALALGVFVGCAGKNRKPVAPDELRQSYVDAIWEVVDDKDRRREVTAAIMQALHVLEDASAVRRETYRRFALLNRSYESTAEDFIPTAQASNELRARMLDRYLEMRARIVSALSEEEWRVLSERTAPVFRELVLQPAQADREARMLGRQGGSAVEARWFEGIDAATLRARATATLPDGPRKDRALAVIDEMGALDDRTLEALQARLRAYDELAGRYAASPMTLRSRIFEIGAVNRGYEQALVALRDRLKAHVEPAEWGVLFAPKVDG